ncbi:putative purple acid phosphatase [Danaus plexippus plexippus]|uniref:Purple acid phosphatase n=1 Tax=Danaus plexippus plexippus TaxID=278856 RepID=A0A212FKI6_DANPL|nr:putative purple acid phosphatase [Danaus plexippus plexippus]
MLSFLLKYNNCQIPSAVGRDARSPAHVLQRQETGLLRPLAPQPRRAALPRRARPWLVMFGHRPMYCSNSDDVDCSVEYTRKGLPFLGLYSLEPLLKEYHVDLVVWAHEHSYERSWPLYDGRVYNGTEGAYVNPRAPVHVVTGSAGCQEDTDKFQRVPPEWSAFRSSDYGYTRLAADRTAIHIQQVDVDLRGQVIDSFTIVKDRHVPFDV